MAAGKLKHYNSKTSWNLKNKIPRKRLPIFFTDENVLFDICG